MTNNVLHLMLLILDVKQMDLILSMKETFIMITEELGDLLQKAKQIHLH